MPAPVAHEGSTIDAVVVVGWLTRFADLVDRDRVLLTELDTSIGDGDHGINLARGMGAVRARLGTAVPEDSQRAAAICRDAGMTLISTVGGASGPLYGTFLRRLGGSLPADAGADLDAFAIAARAGLDGIIALGHAEPGDKTMVDAMGPAVEALETAASGGAPLGAALRRAAMAAAAGSDGTIPLIARKGRASYLGDRSRGHRDPGAASTALLFEALADAFDRAPAIPDAGQAPR